MSSSTTAEPTIEGVLADVKGLGSATIAKAFDALDISGSLESTPEQRARAADASTKDGLKGKALAMWVITGANTEEQIAVERARNGAPTSNPASSTAEFTWPKRQAELLLDYLQAEVTGDADAPNKGAPFIDKKGILRFHGRHWREWLAKEGMHPTVRQAGEPPRNAGMKMRPFALPGGGSGGFYTGPAPKGTASLPRRVVERAARGTGSSAARKPANPFSKFSTVQIAYLRTVIAKGRKGEIRDGLLAAMPEAPQDAPPPSQEPDSSTAEDTAPESTDAPQAAA